MAEKRLIDADAFIEFLEHKTRCAYPNMFPGLLEAIDFAKNFPTADAVEVVRCKSCKNFLDPFCLLNDKQNGQLYNTAPDNFCSYGKKK